MIFALFYLQIQRQHLPFAFSITLDQIFGARPRSDTVPAIVQYSRRLPIPMHLPCLAELRRQLHAFRRECDASYTHSSPQTATPATRVAATVRTTDRYGSPTGSGCDLLLDTFSCLFACNSMMVRYGPPAAGCRMPGCCWFRQPRHRKSRRKIVGPNDDCKA